MGRHAPDQQHPKLVVHVTDSLNEFVEPSTDDVFIALESTLKAAGDREVLAQAARPGEKLALLATTLFKTLIPGNYQAIAATDVASALVQTGQPGRRVLLSGEMQSH